MQFSPAAQGKILNAFTGLFPPMTVVFHITGGRDVTLVANGEVRNGRWQSPEYALAPGPGEKDARVLGASVLNDRGELVGQFRADPPHRFPDVDGGRLAVDSLSLEFDFYGDPPG